jgi:hypothetical protein
MISATLRIPDRPAGQPQLNIVHISDTRNRNGYDLPDFTQQQNNLVQGNILIHSADWSDRGTPDEHRAFGYWMISLIKQKRFSKILLVSGNHEHGFDQITEQQQYELLFGNAIKNGGGISILNPKTPDEDMYNASGVIILHDKMITIGGVRFYGTPWGLCGAAFCLWGRDKERAEKFSKLYSYNGTDVLITHNPPWMVADLAGVGGEPPAGPCQHCGNRHPYYEHWGDYLLNQLIEAFKIKLFMCGHVHQDAMLTNFKFKHNGKEEFNCLVSNAAMDLAQKPHAIVITASAAAPSAAAAAVAKNNNVEVDEVTEKMGRVETSDEFTLSETSSSENASNITTHPAFDAFFNQVIQRDANAVQSNPYKFNSFLHFAQMIASTAIGGTMLVKVSFFGV